MTAAQVPLAAWLLFAAPVTAILTGFFVFRRYKPEWTHLPILLSCMVVTGAAFWLAADVYTGRQPEITADFSPFRVDRIALMQSTPQAGGTVYRAVETFALGEQAG